ncbi:helix-turn-helix transcriptional regulator [Mariniluteicoccus endophyticus]
MPHDLGHRWSIAELARVVHVSGSHLMRLFTEEIGMAPIAWLTRRRVQEMARLLRQTRLSILEIARQAGWRDRGHASEQFKRITWAQDSNKARTETIDDGKGSSLVRGVGAEGLEPPTSCL